MYCFFWLYFSRLQSQHCRCLIRDSTILNVVLSFNAHKSQAVCQSGLLLSPSIPWGISVFQIMSEVTNILRISGSLKFHLFFWKGKLSTCHVFYWHLPWRLGEYFCERWSSEGTELQWMFCKALLQGSCYVCSLSELTEFSCLFEISMFSFSSVISISQVWPHICVSDRNVSLVPCLGFLLYLKKDYYLPPTFLFKVN